MDSIPILHAEVQELEEKKQTAKQHELDTLKEIQEETKLIQMSYELNSLRYCYFTHSSAMSIELYARHHIMKNSSLKNLIEDSDSHPEISKFVSYFPQIIKSLPKILQSTENDLLSQSANFLPSGLRIKDFFAHSTLPMLFGHLWNKQQRMGYINFLIQTLKPINTYVMKNYRMHWLFDCFKQFILSSDIKVYLKRTLQKHIITTLRNDLLLNLITKGLTQDLFDRCVKVIERMINSMHESLDIFPGDVRLLMRKFAKVNEDKYLQRLETIFLECLIVPAISFPFVYGILPASFYLDTAMSPQSRLLQQLAQIFRLILHPSQVKLRFPNIDDHALKELKFKELLEELGEFGEEFDYFDPEVKMDGIFMTLQDVYIMAHIIKNSTASEANSLRIYAEAIDPDPFDELSCIYFQFPSQNKPEKPRRRADLFHTASTAFYTMLSALDFDPEAPDSLNDFIEYHVKKASKMNDRHIGTLINNFVIKMNSIGNLNQQRFCKDFNEYITSKENENLTLEFNNNKISFTLKQLKDLEKKKNEQNDQLLPILYFNVFESFISKTSDLEQDIQATSIIQNTNEFRKLFVSLYESLRKTIAPYADYCLKGVTQNLHCMILQNVTLVRFIEINPECTIDDNNIESVTDDEIYQICIEPTNPKIRKLFDHPSVFFYAQEALQKAEFLQTPLLAMEEIAKAINLTEIIFILNIGTSPQADELTPCINYLLLTARVPHLYSLTKYIEHFLSDDALGDIKFLPEKINIALTHFINHTTALKEIIMELREKK